MKSLQFICNQITLVICGIICCFGDDTLRYEPLDVFSGKLFSADNTGAFNNFGKNSTGTDSDRTAGASSTKDYILTEDVISSCMAFVDTFSEAAANHTRCSLSNARPLRYCQNCVHEYLAANSLYKTIMEGGPYSPKDAHGILCRDMILNSDRIRIVVRQGSFMEHLWEDCHCSTCYASHPLNSTSSYVLSNKTKEFLQLANLTTSCFENSTHGMTLLNGSACTTCWDDYSALNKYFDDWDSEVDHDLCMDVVDIMNATRYVWNENLHCHRDAASTWPMLAVAVFFCLVPLGFYCGIGIFSTRKKNKLLRQHRLHISRTTSISAPLGINDSSYPGTGFTASQS